MDDTSSGCDSDGDVRSSHERQTPDSTEDAGDAGEISDMLERGRLDMGDLMAVHRDEGRTSGQSRILEMRVGSVSAEVVAPTMFAEEYKFRPSPGSRAGAKHRAASGNYAVNRGEKRITMMMEEGEVRTTSPHRKDIEQTAQDRVRRRGAVRLPHIHRS